MDVSRMTGLPWSYERVHSKGIRRPYMDLTLLGWWDRWRVLMARLGGYAYLDATRTPNQCVGCQAGWALRKTQHGFTVHEVPDSYPGDLVGCTIDNYV